ncbi:hypothetical protein MYSTI_04845 [Myxococcus stipitatus DSM 14675]|uniref:Lipoprotein n=1 Tax=Myxococcus stipitatus (strain DSM 14675 / JCM 12634 / Mx s8) TaxID=1278073 RepID=L7UI53_MYXSD|nr:hypothetical protein [Myxococcus stipitatus]AGC46134.1 hypothetical protein MYSTI_04845 [Myxococcus stipitatus DSM 14675]
MGGRRAWAVLLCWGLVACSRPKPMPSDAEPRDAGHPPPALGMPGCDAYGPPRQTGSVPRELPELSGLAASARYPGVFWAHNDSGNDFELFAIDESGRVRARLTLTGANPRDVEDVAVAPCSPGSARTCVFLADIGDNFELRDEVRLYRLPEPDALGDASVRVEALAFKYPDEAHDAEALVADPRSGRLAVITKTRRSLGDVYALDGLAPGVVTQATKLGTLVAPGGVDRVTTAASFHPSGQRLLVRTYSRVWELRQPGAENLESLLRGSLVEVPGASQAQAEAASYLPDGDGYLLGTEFSGQPLWHVGCR